MINALNILGYNNTIEYQEYITNTLSSYTEKFINADGSVSYKEIRTTYFLDNDNWDISFWSGIEQFKKQYEEYKYKNKKMSFKFNNFNVNMEIKFLVYNKIFNYEWSLKSTIVGQLQSFRRLYEFINEKYPYLNSLFDLDVNKVSFEWIDWLENKGIKTMQKNSKLDALVKNKVIYYKTPVACFINNIYEYLFSLVDSREEWEKDTWDVRNLEKYGITYNKSKSNYFIRFTSIKNAKIKNEIKKYFKQRLLSNDKFTFGAALNYTNVLPNFINFISEIEPNWNDLKSLERHHIEKYIESLNAYAKENLTRKNANPKNYKLIALRYIRKFLSDIQLREYSIAPIKNVRILIYPEDVPTLKKKPYDKIDYVPEYVLQQLFDNINNLHKDVIPVVWIMYKTGLRISDVLGLKQDCLIKLNNNYWIETDIKKTYIEGHRIPIDDELAKIISVLIANAEQNSNKDTNPENYIFIRYSGRRKGNPYPQYWIQLHLNAFSRKYHITDEIGNLYHFKNHSFRHTYAIKMLNGGADILTVQELLAHASPEMTMRYAKLLDGTKRRVFDNVVKQGVFSFDIDGKIHKETNEEIPQNILDMLWTNHKLNAIDTPYGTCMQRSKGKCTFAKQPPCLTCNGGKPCKNLGVGIFEGDVKKYEIHINSTKALIEQAKTFNRKDMTKENEELLNLYEEIYDTISNGNIVYGRLERLMKQGDTNE